MLQTILEQETTRKMKINRLTLAFSGEVERRFRNTYFYDSLFQFRAAFLMVTILYAGFGFLDSVIIKEYAFLFHIIRFAVVVPLLSFVFILSFSKVFKKVWQEILFICFIVAGGGITVMTLKAPENYTYYAGMMLIFSAGYFFISLRFFWATIAGWTTLLLFNFGAVFFSEIKTVMLVSNDFFFVSANLIGMFAAYNIEFYKRRDFFLNQQLDRQNTDIIEANKNLESKVAERTKELNTAKEQAEESDRLKSAFLANMSHEIRTPMNGILGFAELLKEPGLSGEEQHEYLGIIERSGTRMINIINDIVDISKIESGDMKVSLSQTNVNDQLEFIYSFFKPEVEQKGLSLTMKNSLPSEEAILLSDREKLYAILTNLVKNAIKYTMKGSIEFGCNTIETLHATSLPTSLQFFVKDTGIGIPVHRQEAIFERFIQADITKKQAYQGAGLGLAISKAYVEMLGGKIWVESKEGIGSTFYFTLPFRTDKEEMKVTKNNVQEPVEVTPIKKLKILLVEDDDPSSQLISIRVRKFSKELISVKTGPEAVEVCRSQPDIDLILMDIQMPEMDGYEATRQIRAFNKQVIIIAQTAYALSGDREKAIESGCNDYLSKPIRKSELLELINIYF